MNSVLRAGLMSALGIVGLCAVAASARAQEEAGDDVITKKVDNSKQTGKIKSEDVKGVVVSLGKGTEITLGWKDVKSIDYAGGSELKQAKAYFDANSMKEAIDKLEELRKRKLFRPLLKPHVLNLLGASYYRLGDMPKATETLGDLFAKFPKTQFLVQGAGETLINAYLAKNQTTEAAAALDTLAKAVSDPSSIALLKGRVLEATKDFVGASSSYKSVLDGGADADTKSGAELGIARCLLGQKKTGDAEAKFQALCTKEGAPVLVLAGAWNGRGDIWYQAGAGKNDPEVVTDALYAYLRACVQYVPQGGDSTTELERGLKGAYDCFKALSEMEKDPAKKKKLLSNAKERLDLLRAKFPGSQYL